MSFITNLINKITDFRVKIGDKLNTLKSQIGQLNLLTTNDKTSLVGAVNEVNNIQIGGRNLALNSEQPIWNPNNFGLGTSVKMDDSTGKFTRITSDIDKNVSVFGFYVEGSNLGDHSRSMYFRPQGSSATVWGKTIPADVWTLVKDEGFTNPNGYNGFATNVIVIDVKKFKIEKGNKATDWTPAPEDQVSNWSETDSTKFSFIKNKPTIPTVNDGKLTLTTGTGLNGSTNFTANQSSNSIFDVSIASTHKLPTVEEWNALPTTSTITRLRGTTSGTYTSGDLTLLAGSNVSIAQSGNNFTINATDTNTTYTAGNGLTLTGTVFSLPVTTSGSGNVVSEVTQTTNGITVNKGISAMTTSHIANNINQNLRTSSSPTFIKINNLNLKGGGSLGSPTNLLTGNTLSSQVLGDVSDKDALATFRVESNITKDGGIPVFAQWGASILAQSGDTMFTLSANSNTPEIFVSAGNTTNNVLWNKKLAFSHNEFPLYAQAFYENSLRELKENIKPFNKSGIELINSLDIVTFDRKDSEVKNKIGIIADDSIDEVLSTKKDAVDLYNTVFIQAKAIQELDNKNKILEERISQLEELIKNML